MVFKACKKAQKIMTNQGSSMQNGSKLGHSKCALERWETELTNCEVTHQVIWPIAKSLTKRDGPKAPYVIHGPLCPIFYPT
jgi:hypothetical protein